MAMPAAPQNHTDQAIMVGTNVMGRIKTTESPTLNGSGIYLNQLFSSQGNAFSLTHAYRGLSLQAGRTRVATRRSVRGATCICHLGTEYALMVPGDTSTHFGGICNNHKRPYPQGRLRTATLIVRVCQAVSAWYIPKRSSDQVLSVCFFRSQCSIKPFSDNYV